MKKQLVYLLIIIISLISCGKKTSQKPNIVLVTIDTLRADYLSCYGHKEVNTPNMDAIAASGIQFMRNIAPSQCTNPSHASILTSLHLSVHKVMDNQTSLADEAVTLTEILQKNGYYTLAAVSARHLNPKVTNFDQGFNDFLESDPVELDANERNSLFLKKLKRATGKQFFAWVHYFDPHGLYAPPTPYNNLYPVKNNFDPIQGNTEMSVTKKQQKELIDPDKIIPLYQGEITFLDFQIGRLIRVLKETGVYNNTILVIVADHGESMTEHGIYFSHAGMYNPVLHIPMMISCPQKLPQGIKVNSMTSSIDIFPTLLKMLNIKYNKNVIDGVDLSPSFSNPDKKLHPFVISEAVNGVIRTIFLNDYKLMKPYPKDWACPETYLFKPWSDYLELNDLKNEEPELASEMETILETWLKQAQKNQLNSKRIKNLDKKSVEALKELGYL